MNGWTEEALTKNDATGYWSLTIKNVPKGTYQYGFMVDNNWTEDKLNKAEKVDGNNVFTIEEELVLDTESPVVNAWGTTFNYDAPDAEKVYVAGSMNGWDTTATPLVKDETTGCWTITLPLSAGDYQYKFVVDGEWTTDPLNANTVDGNSAFTVAGDEAGISPVVNGTSVTFVYPDENQEQTQVRLAGTMTGWQDNAEEFTYNASAKQWELTKTLSPGSYQYKFILGDSNWINDPSNSNIDAGGNNVLLVSGLADDSISAPKGKTTALSGTTKYYGGDNRVSNVKVTYEVPANITGAAITDNNLTVEEACAETTIPVTMKAGDYTATLTINIVDAVYEYTIYYYDEAHNDKDAADLWIWEKDGANGTMYDFTETEELSDGRTWLKAVITLPYTDLGIIACSGTDWTWQSSNGAFYSNTNNEESVTLYILPDDTKVYTELPEIVEYKDRYVMLEYVRPAGDYDSWSLYTWNSGFGSEVSIDIQEINGKYYFIVPIKKSTTNLSFVVRRTEPGNDWAEKDGGDNNILTPTDQTVIKGIFTQGAGITYEYPANMGYKLDPQNGQTQFFYRDDELVLTDTLNTLEGKVKVEVDGKLYDMTYDEGTARFVYNYKDLTEGDHYYRFCIDGEYVLDTYNDRKETKDGTEYSVYTYKKYEVTATAEFSTASIDYTMNSVLKVKANAAADMEVTAVSADISVLGGSSAFEIDPQLMAGTIAVKETVAAGTYTIPVTIKDQYENVYTASADINVVAKTDDDFDWDEAVIYFMVTDRFFDGNPSNNTANGAETYGDNLGLYHGGDFAGVTAKLDYLKDLGINTIWITPIVDNIPGVTVSGDGAEDVPYNASYHGYWAADFTSLDPTLGTEEEFKTLLSEAHSRDMKIMVDVVLNHAGYGTEDTFGDMIRSAEDTVSGDDVLAPLSGLPDFATEKAEVREQLVAWQTAWMTNYDIDYFRVDTVKHVEDTTWKAFKNSLTEANPEFKMIGEYSGAGYTFDGGQLRTGQMDSVLDFDFNDFGQKFATGDISSVEKSLEARNSSIDNTATLGSFLGSHDEDGLVYKLINENGMTEEEALTKMMVAASLQITAKGQPVIYYGEEIGLYGANNYPYQTNRYDFDWSRVTDDNVTLNHYKELLSARNAYTDVFAKGTRTSLAVSDEKGYLAFDRVYDGQHVVTALNITDEAQSITFELSEAAADGIYTDLIAAGAKIDGTTVTLTIPAASEGGTYMFTYSGKTEDSETPEDTTPEDTTPEDTTPEDTTPGNTETPGNTTENGASVEVKSDTVVTRILNSLEELLQLLPLTQEERDAIAAGARLQIELLISNINYTVSKADQQLVMDKVNEELSGYYVGQYLDISLRSTVGDMPTRGITQLNGNMKLELTVPENLKNTNKDKTRTYAIVRIHDGKAEVLKDLDDKDETITFETDRFSVYAIAFKDADAAEVNAVKGGDTTQMAGWILAMSFAAIVVVGYGRKKHAGNK